MSDLVYVGKKRTRLRDRDLLGEGGEGRVYRIGDVAVKVFTVPDAVREQKLRAFPQGLPSRVVAPLDLVTDPQGSVIGFSMRALEGAVDLHRFAQRRWRAGQVPNRALLGLFRELAANVSRLHDRGIVVGDLNDGNVMATADGTSWMPWLIDADSMQFGSFRCVVAHERFLDPRLYGVDLARDAALSRESDWYALAVLLFGSLLYVHPYGGSHPAHATMLRRAQARCSVLRADVKRPDAAMRPDVLPDDALSWFMSVFEHDLREPLPSAVLDVDFTTCSCGIEHARTSCPACTARVHVAPPIRARGSLRATRVFATKRGRIVAASVESSLRYAWEEDGALLREGDEVVLRAGSPLAHTVFSDPRRVVRIAGNATWVGAAGRFTRVLSERELDSMPVGTARGELAADAGPAGLVFLTGDTLVRAESGTRIGQVLEEQTLVRTGTSLGFAFYRASALTVAFVFDPRRGTLRQIEGFPALAGKLVGWSAVFDDAHVLVTFALEERGHTRHEAFLVDARGEIVAVDDSRRSPALEPSLAGRALSGGSVLLATEEGLVLARADAGDKRRRFVRTRLFADARDLVSPEAELLVGPGGSIYAIGHDEITLLTTS